MKNVLYILFVFLASSLVFVSCSNSNRDDDSNVPINLKMLFHNKDSDDKLPIKDLDITIEYTTPKGVTTTITNDELYDGTLSYKYGDNKEIVVFSKTTDSYYKADGINLSITHFPLNYPDKNSTESDRGKAKKIKIILRKKGDDKIIFENTFTYTFEDREGNPFLFLKSLEIENPDLENMKKISSAYHIYLDLN